MRKPKCLTILNDYSGVEPWDAANIVRKMRESRVGILKLEGLNRKALATPPLLILRLVSITAALSTGALIINAHITSAQSPA